jgi:hypothetical protein
MSFHQRKTGTSGTSSGATAVEAVSTAVPAASTVICSPQIRFRPRDESWQRVETKASSRGTVAPRSAVNTIARHGWRSTTAPNSSSTSARASAPPAYTTRFNTHARTTPAASCAAAPSCAPPPGADISAHIAFSSFSSFAVSMPFARETCVVLACVSIALLTDDASAARAVRGV